MGDRGNIQFTHMTNSDGKVLDLYAHWSGSALPQMLARALAASRSRWDDESYMVRRIVTEIIHEAGACTDALSWGLSFFVPDNEYDILEVDVQALTVNDVPFETYIAQTATI